MRHLKHFETSQKPKNRQSIHEKFLLHKRELNESQREGGEDIKRDKISENGLKKIFVKHSQKQKGGEDIISENGLKEM